jgi:superfamily II DNA or RNA helicase
VGIEEDEITLSVKVAGRNTALMVYLWPDEDDWGCDCGHDACAHAAAAIIATHHARKRGLQLPQAPATGVQLRYDMTRLGHELILTRTLVSPAGERPFTGNIRRAEGVHTTDADLVVDQVLQLGDRNLPAVGWKRILAAWAQAGSSLTLDGEPITVSIQPVPPVAVLKDHGRGYRLTLHRSAEINESFRGGVARVGKTLRPSSDGGLDASQRSALVRGLEFDRSDEARLVSEILPRLRRTLTVKVKTDRLPKDVVNVPPRGILRIRDRGTQGLEILAQVVYGDPIVAKIEQGQLVRTTQTICVRDPAGEAALRHQMDAALGVPIGRPWHLEGEDAVRWVRDRLPRWQGQVEGSAGRWRVRKEPATIGLAQTSQGAGLRFEGDADPAAVLAAWREGRSLVPLLEGGWAPLPRGFLEKHHELLEDLIAARSDDGTLPEHAVGPAAELAQALDHPPPAALGRLRALLADGLEEMPPARVPADLAAELRPYQRDGVRWLQFLAQAGLGGILADDMGLGKTIQALVAVDGADGPILVVAPTSVLRNWALEIQRFLPGRTVCVFHGPRRVLDTGADFVITSYALLRLDAQISEFNWHTAVLDEAQAIKNPSSKTARAAFALRAKHRFCMTGTPVENRLEELWSQLHFAMPGFLGGRKRFRERFSVPIERGDSRAIAALRKRIGPFILRRLKRDVAKDLPARTDIVLRVMLSPEQKSIYDAVREAGRAEVARAVASNRTLDILEQLLRMRQAACHTGLLPGDRPVHSAKLDQLMEALDEVIAGGHKALVFSQWTGFLDRIQDAVDKAGHRWTRLDGSTRDRQAVIDDFQSPEGPPVFLLSLKAGGTGLNLTAADYVFHTDPWWNPAVEDQATDRAHRIGQTRPVVSVKLIAQDTVEERIVALQAAKRALAEAAIGEAALLGRLTASDMASLLK